jgi:hypothetical protein
MTRTYRILLVLIPAMFVAGCHERSDSVSLDQIIERNTDAMGGRAAIEAVQSIQIDLHIKDPSFEVNALITRRAREKCGSMLPRKASMFSPKRLMARAAGSGKAKVSRSRRLKKVPRL